MNKECDNCTTVMEEFVSINKKSIYMCPYCGSLYLPSETRNNNVSEYESSYGAFIGSKCYNLPTKKQMSYLKYLAKELNYEVDLTKITRFDANFLITEFKNKFDKLPKKYSGCIYDVSKETHNATDEEYAMNHQFDI
jgi:hypothetical protein